MIFRTTIDGQDYQVNTDMILGAGVPYEDYQTIELDIKYNGELSPYDIDILRQYNLLQEIAAPVIETEDIVEKAPVFQNATNISNPEIERPLYQPQPVQITLEGVQPVIIPQYEIPLVQPVDNTNFLLRQKALAQIFQQRAGGISNDEAGILAEEALKNLPYEVNIVIETIPNEEAVNYIIDNVPDVMTRVEAFARAKQDALPAAIEAAKSEGDIKTAITLEIIQKSPDIDYSDAEHFANEALNNIPLEAMPEIQSNIVYPEIPGSTTKTDITEKIIEVVPQVIPVSQEFSQQNNLTNNPDREAVRYPPVTVPLTTDITKPEPQPEIKEVKKKIGWLDKIVNYIYPIIYKD